MNSYIKYNILNKISLNKIHYYCILENNFFIAYEIKKKILNFFLKKKLYHLIKIKITSNIDWNKIYREYQQKDIFKKKKLLLINIYIKKINNYILYTLKNILKYKNKNIILLLNFIKIQYKNNIIFFKKIIQLNKFLIIDCPYLTELETQIWIQEKIKKMNLNLTSKIIIFLSKIYKNNLLFLFKILEVLSLNSYDQIITMKHVKTILNKNITSNIKNWIFLLFSKQKIKAIKTLNLLKNTNYKISYLLRAIQNNLIYYLHINKNYIYKNHNIKIYKIFNILTKIEINNKKNKNNPLIWQYLKTLILLF
ncbi:hypothetical protein [Buchnera aphidicola]|uniref:Uncharacterized protein n=1 Tax=Buchnera aphidicola (Therioaphis trifolii) TaxID=1241884 RepID=A0A4D6YDI6_9GAMM|nr:hypothetical protein [Buchnera aphidicola]QCI27279.1 hypothetical protein D9V81_01490 [Buchnera aphidicola (Therioaphis trifolii)]